MHDDSQPMTKSDPSPGWVPSSSKVVLRGANSKRKFVGSIVAEIQKRDDIAVVAV